MRIPKTFMIRGKRWKVEYKWNLMDRDNKDDENIKCDGLCDPDKRTIFLERSILRVDKWPIFLHELVHAILFEAHISGLDGPAGDFIEEVICDSIETTFDDLFKFRWKRQQ